MNCVVWSMMNMKCELWIIKYECEAWSLICDDWTSLWTVKRDIWKNDNLRKNIYVYLETIIGA